jgi:hypothetical protein
MKRMMWSGLAMLTLFLVSCTKDPLKNMSDEESRIYITNYDTSANFQNYQTFSISDSVAVVQNNHLVNREVTGIESQFIEAVAQSLQARGYTRVTRSQNPDIGLTVSRVSNTTSQVINYNDYGGYYDSWWDPYYWDYPGYDYYFPNYYGVYESTETALVVDAFDLKNSGQTNQIRSLWSGMIRGYGIYDSGAVQDQVAALFNQSNYFKRQ